MLIAQLAISWLLFCLNFAAFADRTCRRETWVLAAINGVFWFAVSLNRLLAAFGGGA